MTLTRREVLSGLLAGTVASMVPNIVFAEEGLSLRIDAARLQRSLEGLSVYGRPAGGSFVDGVSRIAYSDADVAGRKYAMDLMRSAGSEPRIDAAGNITAVRKGSEPSLKP